LFKRLAEISVQTTVEYAYLEAEAAHEALRPSLKRASSTGSIAEASVQTTVVHGVGLAS